MARILRIAATDIERAFSVLTRQYLVGKLSRPQALRHIPHDVVEIGITQCGPHGGASKSNETSNWYIRHVQL